MLDSIMWTEGRHIGISVQHLRSFLVTSVQWLEARAFFNIQVGSIQLVEIELLQLGMSRSVSPSVYLPDGV